VYAEEAIVPLRLQVYANKVAKALKFDLTKAKEDQQYQLDKLGEDPLTMLHHK
jgi:hypothetical protein